jgi:transcriptional regulator with XRE-family HTH domain
MDANQLKRTLNELEMTQGQLASAMTISPNTVSRWITGKHPIPPLAVSWLNLAMKLKRVKTELEFISP